ncbi:hypothetical protein JCM3775_001914 [Rhodotorula graminis]
MPASARAAQVRATTTSSAPVTAIAPLPGRSAALVGSARLLTFVSLNSPSHTRPTRTWSVFNRDRIHRIVLADSGQPSSAQGLRALVVGGKEAVLVDLDRDGDHLEVMQRFHLDDFAGDAAFLDNDFVLISTLHNTIHVFRLFPSSTTSSSSPPRASLGFSSTRPLYSLNAPQRPTLWCTRFDRQHYHSDPARGDEGGIRLGAGSLWGDTFLWDVGSAMALREKVVGAGRVGHREVMARDETLRRLAGHKGAVFTVAFSPCTGFLVTGSDDRTLRVWNLALLPPRTPSPPSSSTPPAPAIEHPHLALWGHSARVWRAVFLAPTTFPPRPRPPPAPYTAAGISARSSLEEIDIASVAEDGTARVWRVSLASLDPSAARASSSAAAPDKGYELVATFRDGHDGRSLWAVEGAEGVGSERDGRRVVLTGGADGALRSWVVPPSGPVESPGGEMAGSRSLTRARKGSKVKAFVAAESVGGDEDGGDLVVVLRDDGSFVADFAPSTSSATSSSLPFHLPPFHTSTAFGGVSPTCIFRLVPSPCDTTSTRARHFTLLAFSNRGAFLRARLSSVRALLGEVVETAFDVRPALVSPRLDEDDQGRVRVAVWDRAAWKVALLEVDLSDPLKTAPAIIASIVLPADPARASTALHLLSPTLLLLGTSAGSIELYSACAGGSLERLGVLNGLHDGGIVDLCARRGGDGPAWAVTSVGRDGARRVTRLEVISLGDQGERYLAHNDGRTVLLDHLGQLIQSFDNPSKKVPSQLVRSSSGSMRFYRVVPGQVHVQSIPAAPTFSAPFLLPGLHGREIRAIEAVQTQKGHAFVATAAENGVLSVSQLCNSTCLMTPLWTARNLPSALKELAWSPRPSSSCGDRELHTLFVCGAQELLQAYIMSTSSSSSSSASLEGELNVLPAGQVISSEGGEVRAMDLAVAALGAAAEGRHLVIVGYSDGSLKIWGHDARSSSFSLVARSVEASKCILSVEVVEVELSEVERRWVVVTGASDGLLALRDVTSLVLSSSLPQGAHLSPPSFAFRPHQSGVNALALSCSKQHLMIATGGDDNALSVGSLELSSSDGPSGPLCARLVEHATLSGAHASSIQGLDFLSPTILASSSAEQRLNLYSLSRKPSSSTATTTGPALELELSDSTPLNVADCGAQAVLRRPAGEGSDESEEARWQVLIAGIGVEVVEVGEACALE